MNHQRCQGKSQTFENPGCFHGLYSQFEFINAAAADRGTKLQQEPNTPRAKNVRTVNELLMGATGVP